MIFGEIIIIVATRGQILKLKCTNSMSAGVSPQTPQGSLQRSTGVLAGFKGPTSKGRGGKVREEKEGEGMDAWGGVGREGKGGRKCKFLWFHHDHFQ